MNADRHQFVTAHIPGKVGLSSSVPQLFRQLLYSSIRSDSASQIIQALISSSVLQVRAVALINLAQSLNQRLGQGESDAIALGIELDANYVLLDDLAARKEAIRLGLTIRGTLAVINKMRMDRTIKVDNLDNLYARCVEIDFRVKRSIFEQFFLDE